MEPVDPGKNAEGTGCSKRRISSILKAPRKSLLLQDSEQQENEVETAKPVEKRNSRRVSFAPANDVLLFAKDAKNASPARNPLQELMGAATATTQNRVQMVTAEDTSPQIMGIDTLLNAPLHASQQRVMVHFDSGVGENTVVFSTEDADMDMTHSHTININSDADLLGDPDHRNYDLLLSGGGNVADVFTEVPPSHFVRATNQASALLLDKKADSSVEKRTVSTMAPLLDPGFKDFLSNLSKLSPSSTGMTPSTSDGIKSSLVADVDKENQMPKSVSSSRNTGESFNGSAFRPDDDVSMDVTEAQTGRILGGAADDDPFQCLFPTQEMYEKSERKSQARGTKQQQSCGSLESNDRKANKPLINLSVHSPLESHKVCSGLKNDFREKTVVFTADEFMDITQNLTGSVASADRSLLQHNIPTNDVDQENCPPSPNRSGVDPAAPVKPGGDFCMAMTGAGTALGSDDVFQFLIPSEEMQPLCKSQKKEIFKLGQQNIDGPQSSGHKGLKTSSKLNMEPQRHQLMDKVAAPDDYREKTLRFSADDDSLDVTQSRTNIKPNPLQNVNVAPSCEEKAIRFYADDVEMDMTQCLTTNIATDLASDKFSSLLSLSTPNNCVTDSTTMAATSGLTDGFTVYLEDNMDMTEAQAGRILEAEVSEEMRHKHESLQAVLPTEVMYCQSVHGKTEKNLHQQHKEGFGAPDYTETSTKTSLMSIIQRNQVEFESKDGCREKIVRFDAADVCMDVTQCNTMDISSDLPLPNQVLAANGEKTVRFGANDAEMDVTKSHTVNILSDLPPQSFINVTLPANGEKTVRFNANDAAMDITRSHTVDIAHHLNVLVHNKEDFVPAEGERTQRFGASDAEMDVTKCHTMNIMRDLPLQSFPNVTIPSNGEKTLRFSAQDAEMDVTKSHTVNIMRGFPNVTVPSNGEKTERFSSNEAAMDVTRSHTVNIFTDLKMALNQNNNLLPAGGEKTMRFNANDAAMDITKSHTVNIVQDLDLLPQQNVDVLPADGERTVRFGVNDAEMDVTKSHTVNIRRDLSLRSFPNLTIPSNGEKTVRFSLNEAAMDVTRSHTVNIVHDLDLLPHPNVDALRADGERTVRFGVNDEEMESTKSLTGKVLVNSNVLSDQIVNPPPAKEKNLAWLAANDVTMDITQSHTVSIVTDFDQITDSSPTDTERISNTFETGNDTKSISKNYKPASRHVKLLPKSGEKTTKFTKYNATIDTIPCLSVNIVSNPLLHPVMSDQNAENMNDTLAMKETNSGNCGLDSNPSSSTQSDLFQSSCAQGEVNRSSPSCPDSSYSQCKTKEPDTDPENESSSLGSDVGKPINKTKTDTEEICASVDQIDPLASSTDDPPQHVSSKQNPHSKSFKESVSGEYRPEAETQAVSQKIESSPSNADQNADVLSSRMSRRKSLADLQSKVKRLSQLINAAPDPAVVETCTASLLHLDPNMEKNTNDAEAEQLSVATSSTPFSLKTKRLMSRLSVGGFKPKLPKRNTADEVNKSAVKEPTTTFTVSVPNQRSQFDKITDIHDEELVDCEDFSETIDTMTPEKFSKKDNSSNQFSTFQPLEEDFAYMDNFTSSSQKQKRSLPENEDETEEDEKRKKMCTEFTEMASQSDVDYERNMAAACMQTIDSPNNTISRCEIASESTFKHSLFESQLEDHSSDGQKKLEDGTITVLEFFNLFSIDFVIHNPRQSILPGRLLDNSNATALDLLKDKHISRPKQTVYEADVKTLTEKVEGLKYRMHDLGKPLKTVNRSLWEEVNHFSEKELKSFGAKLKERNNYFRKNSKAQSHEMKEELYANLVRVNLEEQQKLRGTISQADEMIQSLDSCISELEAELDEVVEKGSEDKLSLKSLQEEMSKVTETLADHERQTSELGLEKKKNSSELTKLKAEERKLENYIDTLNMLNEWRLEEKNDKEDNCSVFTFLHKTLFLQLVYEKTKGNDADSKPERKITNISFKFNLSDEKSQCHARLVHKLVSQFIEGESDWLEKYPTSGHVPKLLHDVSLVVSRCRLVGEELRLLKMWGSLRFDILHISCSQTQIHIVFSSLKKLSKFEVVFGVRLNDQICVFHVHSFKNLIGNTTIQQIEEVVASLSPGRNLFTRIIKKLHETLLS